MFNIEEELKKLPDKPGVYLMHDENDTIIYVGKAISLKNRVRQYFRKNNKTERIQKMVSQIKYFEYIVVDNEAEALILECNLIKKNMPKYNVLLKDDKTYPYIKIDIKSEFPNVSITRKIVNDGSKYFGPYANSGSAKEMIDFIKHKYKIRQCKNFKDNTRACLNYHINRCFAPCIGNISREEYMKQINEIIDLLEGKTDKIIRELKEKIKQASENLNFEEAAYLRDKMIAIQNISEKQKVSNISENNIDVIGISKNEFEVCIEMFFVRGSKMIGREHYFFDNLNDLEEKDILNDFIKQYYMGDVQIPKKIMLQEEIEDKELIQKILEEKAGRRIEIKTPLKGEKLRFVEMAKNNALVTLNNRSKTKMDIVKELQKVMRLEKLPRKIECFDISNISGEFMVAGMCVLKDGEIKRNLSRRFKIKTVIGQDDPRCMNEVVTRRLKHSLDETNDGFGSLPDVIFADGGITQMRAIKSAIKSLDLDIPVFGMVKNDKHTTRALINENREELPLNEELMNLITNFQDEVHNTAIEYHRKLRDKEIKKSELDKIKGIGENRKKALLKEFDSIDDIRNADISRLMEIKGITKEIATQIKQGL